MHGGRLGGRWGWLNNMAYLLFAGADYYPEGGARDLKGKFDTIDLAIEAHDPCEFDYEGGWANVLCLDSMRIVKRFWRGKWIESDEDAGNGGDGEITKDQYEPET